MIGQIFLQIFSKFWFLIEFYPVFELLCPIILVQPVSSRQLNLTYCLRKFDRNQTNSVFKMTLKILKVSAKWQKITWDRMKTPVQWLRTGTDTDQVPGDIYLVFLAKIKCLKMLNFVHFRLFSGYFGWILGGPASKYDWLCNLDLNRGFKIKSMVKIKLKSEFECRRMAACSIKLTGCYQIQPEVRLQNWDIHTWCLKKLIDGIFQDCILLLWRNMWWKAWPTTIKTKTTRLRPRELGSTIFGFKKEYKGIKNVFKN